MREKDETGTREGDYITVGFLCFPPPPEILKVILGFHSHSTNGLKMWPTEMSLGKTGRERGKKRIEHETWGTGRPPLVK